MKINLFFDSEKVYIGNSKNDKINTYDYEIPNNPNIPKINYLKAEYLKQIFNEEFKTDNLLEKISLLKNQIIIAIYDDFSPAEQNYLLEIFLNNGFHKVYLVNKSLILTENISDNFISVYTNERNTIITKIAKNNIEKQKIISNAEHKEFQKYIGEITDNQEIKIYGEVSDYSGYIVSQVALKTINENFRLLWKK